MSTPGMSEFRFSAPRTLPFDKKPEWDGSPGPSHFPGTASDNMLVDRMICVAPMMRRTDRHERYFLRLVSPHAYLYSEMVSVSAILKGDRERHLRFDEREHPVALQVGGSNPTELAECARIGQDFGYDEVNLNVGCPSERVQSARFGACLMAEPDRVAECVAAMRHVVRIPVTVKTRIGIDERDRYEDLAHFVQTVAAAGCRVFIVHARKAWLKGVSPKANRERPPLRYEVVHQLKQAFPCLEVIVNGGIRTVDQVRQHLRSVDGVMIGRRAYEHPFLLAELDRAVLRRSGRGITRRSVLEAYLPYAEQQLRSGVRLAALTRHILGLFHGLPGAGAWRRHLTQRAVRPGAGPEVIRTAARKVLTEGGAVANRKGGRHPIGLQGERDRALKA